MTDDELKQLFQQLREDHAETRRHFDVTADRIRDRVDTVAEPVASLDEKLDRRTAGLDDHLRDGFNETQSMIKFSHSELDRRVTALEHDLAELRERVERLESDAH